ncbi:MAG: protein phosphatase 2C domain-containing protein [Sandaracinaceae bacterium]|nr:protein phosphatase 2C domain-containing protein [Sandaracinaceae bacterium]
MNRQVVLATLLYNSNMHVIAAGATDIGKQREHNEDAFCIVPDYHLYAVADGMGGHSAGDVASRMALYALQSFFHLSARAEATWPFHFDPHLSVEANRLIAGIRMANRRIFDASNQSREVHGMGTTIVTLHFSSNMQFAHIAHVGDSRCYRIREGEIVQLTRDHSLLNDFLDAIPGFSIEQLEGLPKNVITRALGIRDSVVVDLITDIPRERDIYILCSDGLSGMVSDQELLEICTTYSNQPDKAVRKMIEQANNNGGEDNVTAVVLLVTAQSEI